MPFRVREQAVYAASNMANLKSERWQAKRSGIQLLIAQNCTPQCEVFVSKFERMNNRARNGRNIGMSCA